MFKNLRENWQSFIVAYFSYFKKRLAVIFGLLEKSKKLFASLLYRQRGRFAQPIAHLWLGIFLFLGVVFSTAIEETVRGQQMNWDEAPAGNEIMAYGEEGLYNASTFASEGLRGEVVDYVVKPGDTLSSIAKMYGITVDTIIWANNLSVKTAIKTGQKLKIPPVTGIVHKVGRGETVYSIAKKYGVEPQEIVDFPFNSFANDETFALAIGQSLTVPNGVMPEDKPVVPQSSSYAAVIQGAGSGNFIWPTSGRITQRYSWYHPAVDIADKNGPAVTAADSGTVVSVIYSRFGYGNHLIIDHGNGFKTLYAHMNKIYVSAGNNVSQGQSIGQMGSTGRSTGTHLHFEIIQNGTKLNPLTLLK
jgi:murein DD-endopeptidase MepM/ murein hydrolase activator NlpD